MSFRLRAVALLVCCAQLMAQATMAQTARSSAGGDTRMQQALQQLTNEKAQLQAENARLQAAASEADELRTGNEKLSRELEAARARLSRTEANSSVLTDTLDTARSRLDELVAKYRELATQFRETEIALARAQAELAERNRAFLACADGNDELAVIALDALDRYERKGCFGKLAQAEPFTGIKRARIENLVDEYQYQVESLRMPAADSADLRGQQTVP